MAEQHRGARTGASPARAVGGRCGAGMLSWDAGQGCGAGMRSRDEGLHLHGAGSGEGSGGARPLRGRDGTDGTGWDRTGRDGPYLAAAGPGRTMLRGRAGAAAAARSGAAAAAPDAPSLFLPLRLQRAAKSAGASSEEEPPQWLPPARAGRSYSGDGGEAGGRAGGIHTSRPGMPPPRLTPRLPRRRPAAASRFPEARPGGHRRGEPAPHACVPAGPRSAGCPREPPGGCCAPPPPRPSGGCSSLSPREDAPLFPPPRALPGRMLRSPPRAERYLLPLLLPSPHHCRSPKNSRYIHGHCAATSCLWDGWGKWLDTDCQAFIFTCCWKMNQILKVLCFWCRLVKLSASLAA